MHAHDILAMASLDQQVDNRVRKAMGAWINQDGTNAALLRTLARVCGILAPAHVKMMLWCLSDLASSDKEGVADAVGEAIYGLWDNAEFRPRLRDTLILWLNSQTKMLRKAAGRTFLHLALQKSAEGLPTLSLGLQEPDRDWMVLGWRLALEAPEPSPLAYQAFEVWLNAAANGDGWMKDVVIAALVRAVHDTPTDDLRGQRHLNLVRLGERWVTQSAVLDESTRNRLRHELEHRTQLADPHRSVLREKDGPTGDLKAGSGTLSKVSLQSPAPMASPSTCGWTAVGSGAASASMTPNRQPSAM